MSGRNHGRVRRRREETRRAILPSRLDPRGLRSVLARSLARSLKARGRFSEATGAGGIRVELDYTAKGYIYRARMYAEARTSPQRGRPCGFSLDATSRVDSWFRTRRIRPEQSEQTPRNGLPNFPPCRFHPAFSFFLTFLPSFFPFFLCSLFPFSFFLPHSFAQNLPLGSLYL